MGDNSFGYQTRSQGLPPAYSAVDQPPNAYPQHKDLGRPGRLASKWIFDLLNGTLECDQLACIQLNPSTPAHHNLHHVTSLAGVGDNTAHAVCICRTCKKTFTVRLHSTGHVCEKSFERMHHLVLGTVLDTPGMSTKYYPIRNQVQVTCSAIKCTMAVTIDVCDPRLAREWEAHLTDRDAVRKRLNELMEADDRSRYEDLTSPDRLEKLFPAFYLMQYINDVVRSGPGAAEKKVAYRNKFFTVCFWDRFKDLLEYLEFQTTEGDGDKSLVLPCLDEPNPDESIPTTRQAWFEILRAHLYFLVEDHLRADLLPPMDLPIQQQSATVEFLECALDAKYAKSTWKHIGDLSPADFDLLGINKDAHESMLWYACLCQSQTHPEGREKYFDALFRVTRDRENASPELRKYVEEEQLELAIVRSTREAQADSNPLSRAYRSLELPNTASDEMIIFQFQQNMRSASAPERKKLRQDLSLIGRDRKSLDILRCSQDFDPEQAMEFLGLPADADPAFIPIQVNANVNEDKSIDRLLVSGALRSLLALKYSSGDHGDMEALATVLEVEARESWMSEGDSITVAPKPTSQTTGGHSVDTSLPVGLMNIRNTCYLNSILQYFNTVLPVRNVVLNWEEYKLEPTEENIKARRLGGTGVALDKPEAFLAAKFVEEMRALFLEFQSSSASAIKPQQRLALAALKNADRLLKGKPAEPPTMVFGPQPNPAPSDKELAPPPPLPARPSPKPPTKSTEPTVTVNAISDHADTASNVSSATLVDQKDEDANHTYVTISETNEDKPIPQVVPAKERVALDDDDRTKAPEPTEATNGLSVHQEKVASGDSDAKMGGTDGNATTTSTEAKIEVTLSVEEKITAALNDVSVTGTEQQDVEEVMGNILDHFHAAIKPTGTDEDTGKQTDMITETFYWSSVVKIRTVDMNTGKAQSDFRSVPDLSRWMTAFPAKDEKTDLYGALDSNFDQEFQEDGNEMVTAITRAPPILHIYIQRGQEIKGELSRNNNVVEIPQRLFLDRYMDCPTDSELFKKRQRSWNLKRRLQALDVQPPPEPAKEEKKGKNEEIKEAGYEVVEQNVEDYETQMIIDNGEEEYVSINVPSLQPMPSDKESLENSEKSSEDVAMGGMQELSSAILDGDASRRLRGGTEGEKTKVREELSTLFSDMADVAYRLHAVICHGGGLGFGHYWVWIYDFDENVWRSYNDERVEVHRDEEKVLKDLNSSGSPYYVAYVREDEISRMVKIPSRNITAPGATGEVAVGIPDDVDMQDAEVSHVEHRE
ncbi:Ubiquitin carboxyl-terminal hydrolase 2 [Cytospora mali]|uniref:ubiquitinyl hydrolase 1 n=1 Tax=Cytospora mali TaxID=578113 RepID=A0A194UXD7_CYTMA|nr:Ubiquitin carboxyl-terminal hydrolase 2 [Valsa mali var. pyri (nom. inval.)]